MESNSDTDLTSPFSCPLPIAEYPTVLLAHGGGGRLSHQMVQKMFLSQFDSPELSRLHDGAILEVGRSRLAFTTDSYVVSPVFFPGGNIGELAVNGTVNDLAMCGARPAFLSVAFVLEEGLPMDMLWKIVVSMQKAALRAGVTIVTGDTKVVDRGKGDGIFINTAGIGLMRSGVTIDPANARPGDAILLSGPIADHGIAVLSVREGLEFTTQIVSDTAPLNGLADVLFDAAADVHVLRDPTRGGVAGVLNEIAAAARVGMVLEESLIPVREEVRGACEFLGLDPLYVANEGKLLAIVPAEQAERALQAMRAHPLGSGAARIGQIVAGHPGVVTMKSTVGGMRVVDMLSGEQLPRIC